MSEYPDYYPPFMQDFHDIKDLSKVFYTWLEIRENQSPRPSHYQRASDMANWMEFHILLCWFLDFLFRHGWQLYRTRKKRAGNFADIDRSIAVLRPMWELYGCLASYDNPNADTLLRPSAKWVKEKMEAAEGFIPYMPDEVKAGWEKFKANDYQWSNS